MTDLRYPIGQFTWNDEYTEDVIASWLDDIEQLPAQLHQAVIDLTDEQLNTPYREGGWTIRQVVHHVADSHLNAYTRFKLAVTEDRPVIKPYAEDKWAETPDSFLPVDISLQLLVSLHLRLIQLLRSLSQDQLDRAFLHPESGEVTLKRNIGIYAWHGKHHLAHITSLKKRLGW